MKRQHWFSIPLIFLMLCNTVANTRAQGDDPPLDDKFVAALVMMSVNHNMMEGKDEIRDLTALHSFVTDYYEERIWRTQGTPGSDWLRAQKGLLTSLIENKIEIKKSGYRWLHLFLLIFTDTNQIDFEKQQMGIKDLVSGNSDPPQDYFTTMNSLVMTDIEAQVNVLLDIDTISIQPDLAPATSDSTAWSHNVPAIINSTAPLSPFTSNSAAPTGSGNNITPQKPLRFSNNGIFSATVVTSSYTPAPGISAGASNASTVVFPDGNPSAQLSLPLGEYVFCYYWDLGTDADNDGYVDYAHRNTGKVTLSQTSSDNVANAQVVTLSPERVSSPNGKCGENTQQQPDSGFVLTPQESANQGTHTYTCGPFAGEYSTSQATSVFFEDGVDFQTEDAKEFLVKIEPNRYVWNEEGTIIVYTDAGFNLDAPGVMPITCTR